VVASKSTLVTPPVSGMRSPGLTLNSESNSNLNIDGAVRDEDTFVLGEDDDDYSDNDEIAEGQETADSLPASTSVLPPPPYDSTSIAPLLDSKVRTQELELQQHLEGSIPNESENSQKMRTVPYKYYINRNDTLQGLALRFGLDVSCNH